MREQRFASAHLFSTVCPERDTGVALVLSEVSTVAMGVFLAELETSIYRYAADVGVGLGSRLRLERGVKVTVLVDARGSPA